MKTPRKGEIWVAWLDPTAGREQGGIRPVLVVSNNAFNSLPHGLCIIVPLTRTQRNLPTQPLIHAPEGGLKADSVAMCDQVRTISIDRLRNRRGEVNPVTLDTVTGTLLRILS